MHLNVCCVPPVHYRPDRVLHDSVTAGGGASSVVYCRQIVDSSRKVARTAVFRTSSDPYRTRGIIQEYTPGG